jgi:hypothetical protein
LVATRESREGQVTLKIPRPLYDQLKQVIEGSGFHSVTEFAVYVLRDLVSHHRSGHLPVEGAGGGARAALDADEGEVEPLSPDEIEAIRKRLESLGYL